MDVIVGCPVLITGRWKNVNENEHQKFIPFICLRNFKIRSKSSVYVQIKKNKNDKIIG